MSKKPPTKAESARMARVAEMGCIVCRQSYGAYVPAQVHHMTSGGRRRGHMYTIPLCPWHHEGHCENGLTPEYMTMIKGPSFANSRKDFEATFGSEERLLEAVNAWLGLPNNPATPRSSSTSSPNSTTSASGQTGQ